MSTGPLHQFNTRHTALTDPASRYRANFTVDA